MHLLKLRRSEIMPLLYPAINRMDHAGTSSLSEEAVAVAQGALDFAGTARRFDRRRGQYTKMVIVGLRGM